MSKAPVSVLVPVLNEEANIEACLASLTFADEVVVVDSNSQDRTVELAEKLGARVVQFAWDGQFPKKKNWALENVQWANDWVLIVDADERVLPELADEITAMLAADRAAPVADGYYLNRRFMFMGGWLKHCGYYPSWNLRLFRHAKGRYERLDVSGDTGSGDNEVHEHVLLDGEVQYMQHDMLHYAYPTISAWVEKHNRYSSWEAHVQLHGMANAGSGPAANSAESGAAESQGSVWRRKLRRWSRHWPFRPTIRFVYHYFLRLGILDGYRGLVFCRLLAWYEFLSVIKAKEMNMPKSIDSPKS